MAVCVASVFMTLGCKTVPAGHRGIKVYLWGNDKGVDEVELPVGRHAYWPATQEIYIFPVFQQNTIWSKRGGDDKSITFQTGEGVSVNGDFGISYSVDEKSVSKLFQRYRRGIDEITDLFLRNMVRDALNVEASKHDIEFVYGKGRQVVLQAVEDRVRKQVQAHGIKIDRLYSVGDFRLPRNVVRAINAKIAATQRAQQRENEVREARAEAAKKLARVRGETQAMRMRAKARADNARIKAKAEADANRTKAKALTRELIIYEALKRWDGRLPTVTGGQSVPIMDLNKLLRNTPKRSSDAKDD